MVNTISCKVFGHLAETFLPPQIVVLFHDIPIVCWEAPILSVGRECIGWCSRLSVHVEVVRFNPCFHTISTDTNRNISFENDTFLASIVASIQQLNVQVELDVIVICDSLVAFAFWCTHSCNYFGIVCLMFRPLAEVRSTILVSKV